ncbi:WxL domain-containing protein [Enterococcus hirae]
MKKFTSLFSAGIILSTMVGGGLTAFADAPEEPAMTVADTTKTPVTATFQLPDDGGSNPSVPGDPGDQDNTNNNSSKSFAIAYQPKVFDFGTTKLKEEGQQIIDSTNTKELHVGVKDKRREAKSWTLKAGLTWESENAEQMDGTFIQVQNTKVAVNKEGIATDTATATADGVTGASSFNIGTNGTVNVMTANAKQRNDVYDMNLGEKVKLVLPNAKNVSAGTYTGNVTWTLESAPE